ncbi:hypothetical protein IMG5_168400 [Ichthyophthirius multifiliis]|uniref:Tyrosine specific protein phosphatases domain-containing protein n=1 Tax=Ichthyophthirius multifiliis TaxID=5932 RepID=G0R137_ICHMU|nr:hypothetical protein IMG5_168400 [Ichthyophthirius multifiliis]EGR28804.1 hypothetical protein IMG5_168400 [Ichthyophthirius multifiliis]|eukprot:XP_004030040.1 hypothetical protein IMG5_168400 [Ichthyophthirius multifiliis]
MLQKEDSIKKQSCVRFQINYCTQFGQSVYILGNIRSLGNWQIQTGLRMEWNNNCLEINDNDFCISFTIDQIDDNIFIGPYPQSEEDIKQLKNRGIKAVLNLQTYKDMVLKGIKYVEILKFYKKQQINPFNFPIIDMDIIDMCYKLKNVSRLLNFLVEQYKKVYVHCTAGIFRSSQSIIGYYTFYKKFKFSYAFKLLQKQHPISVVSREYIEMVMNSKPVQMANSQEDLGVQDKDKYKNNLMSPQEPLSLFKY